MSGNERSSAATRWGWAALAIALLAAALYVTAIWTGDIRWTLTGVTATCLAIIVGVVGASKSSNW